jgi:hypothetical protein
MTRIARGACAAGLLLTVGLIWTSSQALAQSSSPTRFEQNDPSVAYNAGWSQDTSRSWSGGIAMVATTPGAQATFTFTGPSVNWIGGRGPWSGIADILLDGSLVAEVDTYSKTEEIRVPMFTANGLANSIHTLTIQSTGRMNSASTSTYVVVDAFDVPAPAVSRLQETDPDVTYTAGWTQDNALYASSAGLLTGWTQGFSLRNWSAGTAMLSTTPGAQATFAFNGTGVSWVGARGTQTGIADVFLDGVLVAEIDTYSPTEQIQAAVFTRTGLANANHTLTIQVTGRQNVAAMSALVVVDAFEVTSPGTQVQETDAGIAYGAGWIQGNRDKAYNQGTTAESVTVGAQATFTFTGTGVSWIGACGPQTGIARVFLDGAFVQDVDTYAMTEAPQHTDFTARGLAAGTHALTIQVIGKNPASTNFWILVDAFNVTP